MKEMINLSVVIPAYNEEKSIRQTIDQINRILTQEALDYEIIIVDDGSEDRTKEFIKDFKDVILIEHEINKGYGASLKDGIKKAKFGWICIIDADGTYPVEDISKLLSYVPQHDMVTGARTGKFVKIPFLRKPAKWFLNQLANYLTKTKIPDLNSGLRIFRKEIIERFVNLFPDGFSFTTTLTIACLTNNYKVKFIPINYYKREGKSSISAIRDFTGFVQLIIRLVLYFKPLNFFIPMSLFFILLSFIWAMKDLFIFCSLGACQIGIFSVMLFISGLQIGFLGLLADLIIKRTRL